MKRIRRKVKYLGKTYKLQSLFPADFLGVSYWPFSYYRLPEIAEKNNAPEIKRNWKLKPKEKQDDEAKLAASIKTAVMLGGSITSNGKYAEIKANETLHSLLLAEIYTLTYGLSLTEKYFSPIKTISKDFAEALAIKAKAMAIEPYALLDNVAIEAPELYNPKRYDFNWLILSAGWERERRDMEKAQRETKSKMRRK